MEASGLLAALQEECKCAICRDVMRNPVTLECGHNMCQACLQWCWEDTQDSFPCPLCRHLCQERSWKTNNLLARVIHRCQLLEESRMEGSQQQGEAHLCDRHQQELSLFCEQDMEVLCPGCEQAAHRGHPVKPVVEAATVKRQLIYTVLSPLKKCVDEVEKEERRTKRYLQELEDRVTKKRSILAHKLEQRLHSVAIEKSVALCRLIETEGEIEKRFSSNINALREHSSTLEALLQEVAHQSVKPDLCLLNDFKGTHSKCENTEPPTLPSFLLRLQKYMFPPMDYALKKIRLKFPVAVTLDPHTAHPLLQVSRDKRSVSWSRDPSKCLQREQGIPETFNVLGVEEFHGGRHYWEVQVEDQSSWAVGLCILSPLSSSSSSFKQEQQQPLTAQRRLCWMLQLQSEGYLVTGSGLPVPLALENKPRNIGVYLDYELGQISFYNVNNMSHIHSIQETFSHPLKPYFWVGPQSPGLTLWTVGTEEDSSKTTNSNRIVLGQGLFSESSQEVTHLSS